MLLVLHVRAGGRRRREAAEEAAIVADVAAAGGGVAGQGDGGRAEGPHVDLGLSVYRWMDG